MSGGLAALLDDVAALAKLAAASIDDVGAASVKASSKAAGVVVDDTAVTPRFVEGVTAEREVPIIRKIAFGSIRNKLLIILPIALVLSEYVPWLVSIILMFGGAYLAYEGAEKIWEKLSGHGVQASDALEPKDEKTIIKGAIRTDLILSAEIMVISLNEVAEESFWMRAAILVVVAFVITVLVYGVVALIVKIDDIGLKLAEQDSEQAKIWGCRLVNAMPRVLQVISVVGIAAMLWVGGHILLLGTDTLGWHAPYALVHEWEQLAHRVPVIGGLLAWLVNTAASAVIGLAVGALLVAVMHVIPRRGAHDTHAKSHDGDADVAVKQELAQPSTQTEAKESDPKTVDATSSGHKDKSDKKSQSKKSQKGKKGNGTKKNGASKKDGASNNKDAAKKNGATKKNVATTKSKKSGKKKSRAH